MIAKRYGMKGRGFSLIEVLIAVVVLSFGLLALAALQTSVIRSGSEAKAQSVATGLAKDKLEVLRSFPSIAGYRALSSGSDPAISLGGVNYTRRWTVDRYAMVAAGTGFVDTVPLTGALSPTTYIENNEFKTIDVRVDWTDATNRGHSVAMEDAIASLDPADSSKSQRQRSAKVRGAEVIINNPSLEPGVIPIAVGGSSTAATNPKPVNVARTGDDAIETRFDVVTYAGSTGLVRVQAKVETTVVGCTCTNATTSSLGRRPTYWDGERYAPPLRAPANATAREASGVTQSRYCNECCRDHHDPSGVAGPKFSPRRSSHLHHNLVGSVLTAATASGSNYLEACRLIRTDGIFSTATDLSNDYYNLLATLNDGDSAFPSVAGTANYKNFVTSYLDSRFVAPNPGSGSESVTYNNRTAPDPGAVATLNSLDDPAEIRYHVRTNEPAGKRLHSRGLYIDFLEQQALDVLGEAEVNCKGTGTAPPTAAQLQVCVLQVLPFTTINLTEIADWFVSDTGVTPPTASRVELTVTNNDFSTATPTGSDPPVRGHVTKGTAPENDDLPRAFTQVTSSNSGVAISGDIDPDDAASLKRDFQTYRVAGVGPAVSGGVFQVNIGAYAINSSSPPQVGFDYGTTPHSCNSTAGNNPFVCTAVAGEPLPANIKLRVGNYNRNGTDIVANACPGSGARRPVDMPYKVVYDVTGFTSSSSSTLFTGLREFNNNAVGVIPTGEYVEVDASLVGEADVITATIGSASYLCPSNYPTSGGALNCTGSGSSTSPTWSTTFVTCPGNVQPNFP